MNVVMLHHYTNTHTHNHLMTLCPGLPALADTIGNIHPLTPTLSSNILYQLPPSTVIHSILLILHLLHSDQKDDIT